MEIALSSKANLSFKKTNLDPETLDAVSKSIRLSLFPISSCFNGLNVNFLIDPFFSIILLALSFIPIGTSSKARLGNEDTISTIFFLLSADCYLIFLFRL